MSQWAIAAVRSESERAVAAALSERYALHALMPTVRMSSQMAKHLRRKHGASRRIRLRPLFPGYLFIQGLQHDSDADTISRSVPGLYGVLRRMGRPELAYMAEGLVDELVARANRGEFDECPEQARLETMNALLGSEVVVTEGIMEGKTGYAKEIVGKSLKVEFRYFGTSLLPCESLRAA